MALRERLKARMRKIKCDTYALWLAYRDPRTPWYAKLTAIVVVAYAASPIDLVPDFIPVLGYIDDLILIPLGVVLAIRMIPKDVMADCRAKAETMASQVLKKNWVLAGIIIAAWALALALVGFLIWKVASGHKP